MVLGIWALSFGYLCCLYTADYITQSNDKSSFGCVTMRSFLLGIYVVFIIFYYGVACYSIQGLGTWVPRTAAIMVAPILDALFCFEIDSFHLSIRNLLLVYRFVNLLTRHLSSKRLSFVGQRWGYSSRHWGSHFLMPIHYYFRELITRMYYFKLVSLSCSDCTSG